MSKDFYIKQGDTLPSIKSVLKDSAGTAVNLTGVTVAFRTKLVNSTTAPSLGGAAVIEDAANGQVRYDWQVADTTTAGLYYAHWVVTWGSGKKTTYPNSRYLIVEVLPQL